MTLFWRPDKRKTIYSSYESRCGWSDSYFFMYYYNRSDFFGQIFNLIAGLSIYDIYL